MHKFSAARPCVCGQLIYWLSQESVAVGGWETSLCPRRVFVSKGLKFCFDSHIWPEYLQRSILNYAIRATP